jgi:hypothetical protein
MDAFNVHAAIEVAVSQDVMAVLNAAQRCASDTVTNVAWCLCFAVLVISCWTGKVAFNVHAGDLWARLEAVMAVCDAMRRRR